MYNGKDANDSYLQSDYMLSVNLTLIKRMSILRLQVNGERKHECDLVENRII